MRKIVGVCVLLMLSLSTSAQEAYGTITVDEASYRQLLKEVAQLQADVTALNAQVKTLQSGHADVQSAKPPVPASAPEALPRTSVAQASPPSPPAEDASQKSILDEVPRSPLPLRQSLSEDPTAASRVDNEASPTDPDLAGFFAVPGTQAAIRIGGYAKVDAQYDRGNIASRDQFVPSAIVVDGTRPGGGDFNLNARQTRFSLEVRRPTIFGHDMRFYFENDFYGGGDGQYQFRLRQAYGQLGNTYAGFGFTAWKDPDASPDTIDFSGPSGAVSKLQPSIRQLFRLGQQGSLTLSIERPDTDIQAPAAATGSAATRTVQSAPDLVTAGRLEGSWGHLQLGVIARRLGLQTDRMTRKAWGSGVSLTGSLQASRADPYADLVQFGVVRGRGIERYINDTGGLGLDAVVDGDGALRPLRADTYFVGLTHYWSPQWRSTLVQSEVLLQRSAWLAADRLRKTRYSSVNLIWHPVRTLSVGVEVLNGRLTTQGGSSAGDTRLQCSIQYSFIQ